MSANTNYQEFEDEIIKTLRHQISPSISSIASKFIIGRMIHGIIQCHPAISIDDSTDSIIETINFNERLFRKYLRDNCYKEKFLKCKGNPEKISNLKKKALAKLLELI